MFNLKNKKGITLVALVITIIVLLILAAVTINLAIGERGIFSQSKLAAEKYKDAQNKEENELDKAYQYMIGEVPDKPEDPSTISAEEVEFTATWGGSAITNVKQALDYLYTNLDNNEGN